MKIKDAANKVENYQTVVGKLGAANGAYKRLVNSKPSATSSATGPMYITEEAFTAEFWQAMLSGAKSYLEDLERAVERLGEEDIK